MKTYAIILAGGTGHRMGTEMPKQFLPLGDIPVIVRTVRAFISTGKIDHVITVSPEAYMQTLETILKDYNLTEYTKIVQGGSSRQDSSYNALISQEFNDKDILLIHDAARPFITSRIIIECIAEAEKSGACGVYVPSIDTITEITNGCVKNIPERSSLFYTQTPQAFQYSIIRDAHERARRESGKSSTDDVSLVINAGYEVRQVEGDYSNIKITTPSDYEIAQLMIKKK